MSKKCWFKIDGRGWKLEMCDISVCQNLMISKLAALRSGRRIKPSSTPLKRRVGVTRGRTGLDAKSRHGFANQPCSQLVLVAGWNKTRVMRQTHKPLTIRTDVPGMGGRNHLRLKFMALGFTI